MATNSTKAVTETPRVSGPLTTRVSSVSHSSHSGGKPATVVLAVNSYYLALACWTAARYANSGVAVIATKGGGYYCNPSYEKGPCHD